MGKLNKKDIVWSYFGQISNLTVHIMLTPLIAVKLSAGELGLWYTFTSIYTFITFFDTSFSPLILKNATYCISGAENLSKEGFGVQKSGRPNYELLNDLLCASKKIYRTVAFLFFILLVTIGSIYILFISKDQIDGPYLGAWLIYALGIGINFYIIYLPSVLKGIGHIADSQKIFVLSRSIQLILSIIGVLLGGGLYALSFGFLCGSLLIFIFSTKMAGKIEYLDLRKGKTKNTNEIINIIWFNAKRMVLVTIGRYFSTQGGILICSTFISLEISGAYGLTMQALQAVASISNIYLQTLIPSISAASIKNNNKERKASFSAGICMFWLLYPIGILLVGVFCNPFLRLLHANTVLLEGLPFGILATGYFFLANYVNFNIVFESQNRIPHTKAEFIFGVVNLCGMFIVSAIFDFKIWGIILMQTLMPLCFNAWYWPRQVMRMLNANIKELFFLGVKRIKLQFLGGI